MIYTELPRARHARDDGWLSELVSMNYADEPFNCVHSYVVSVAPDRTRAKHYHLKKEEWLAIAAGKILLRLRDIDTGESAQVLLDSGAETYRLIYVPPRVAHAIENVGQGEASMIIFSRTPEDKADTIPFDLGDA